MTIIELVLKRLTLDSEAALARLCGVNRSCVWEWKQRLDGGIPTRHHGLLVDEARKLKKKLTLEELRG